MWTCESIRPGMAVIPPASMTTSAASTSEADTVPARVMRSPSVRIVSPATKGSRQFPETIWPRLTMASFMAVRCSVVGARQFALHIVGGEKRVHQSASTLPVERPETVPAGHETRAGVEHFILRVARAEFRADRVPGRLKEFHLLLRRHCGRALRLVDDRGHLRVAEIEHGGGQHDECAAGELADSADHPRVKILGQHLCRIQEMLVRHVPFA